MQRMPCRAKHQDEQRNKAGSLECEAVNEDLHSEELYQTTHTTRMLTPIREFRSLSGPRDRQKGPG